ncbi:DUF554 domain-containing protein [Metabacillus sp. GX 13764]|uniref:DUF554 domain-containing protein n=1 Tax=Metabacillus kandeliae TaxID=2900151 RepID=UPI001E6067DE|nr:DUF554 domain-containing protein [Metabacillus kandeliae]MCD7035291.1 DUF554 domain-containing protein [Metabacillus kandeliae]
MVLLGSIVNGAAIIAGTLTGLLLTKIPERMKETVMMGIGLAVMILGISMALKTADIFYVIVSLVLGSILGEWMNLEGKLLGVGHYLERKLRRFKTGNVAEGFVTATLIFVIGAMSIVGALDSGLRGDHAVLMTKSMIDGFTSIILASTLGVGVMISAIPVFLYEGCIALFANLIHQYVDESLLKMLISEITATGGVLIFAIGINMLNLKAIRVANMLPSLLIIIILISLKSLVF